MRSEEHTSELQSHHDLVCRLLLEKKKKPAPAHPPPPHHRTDPPPAPRPRRRPAAPRAPPGALGPRRCFFFNDTATTEIYTLSLHDALPI